MKWRPSRDAGAYFTDRDLRHPQVVPAIREAFAVLRQSLLDGQDVVLPTDGIGTGRAELRERAPQIFAWITSELEALQEAAAPLSQGSRAELDPG